MKREALRGLLTIYWFLWVQAELRRTAECFHCAASTVYWSSSGRSGQTDIDHFHHQLRVISLCWDQRLQPCWVGSEPCDRLLALTEWMCGAAQWKHVTVRRGSGDAGPFVFGAFSSHLYRSHTIVSVLAVSGVQLAELNHARWLEHLLTRSPRIILALVLLQASCWRRPAEASWMFLCCASTRSAWTCRQLSCFLLFLFHFGRKVWVVSVFRRLQEVKRGCERVHASAGGRSFDLNHQRTEMTEELKVHSCV